jgi:hypothetical protein
MKTVKTPETVETPAELSAKTLHLIDAIRAPFSGYVQEMNVILTKASKLAPSFMRAANAWMGETGKGFVHFVRELDANVPVEQKGYRNNPTYNRAVYLKNLVNKPKRSKRGASADVGAAPLPAMTGMVRLIAAIKPLVPEDQLTKLWDIIANEMHWDEEKRAKLQSLVEEAAPLFATRAPRGGPRPVLRIAQPRHTQTEEEAAA